MSTRYEVDYIVQVIDQNASGTLNTLAQSFTQLGPSVRIVDRLNAATGRLVGSMNQVNVAKINELKTAFNGLGSAVQITDRLNASIKRLNTTLNNGNRRLTINTAEAQTNLAAIERQIANIQSGIAAISGTPLRTAPAAPSTGNTTVAALPVAPGATPPSTPAQPRQPRTPAAPAPFTPRQVFKSGQSLYFRGSAPHPAMIPAGSSAVPVSIPLSAFSLKELEEYNNLLRQMPRSGISPRRAFPRGTPPTYDPSTLRIAEQQVQQTRALNAAVNSFTKGWQVAMPPSGGSSGGGGNASSKSAPKTAGGPIGPKNYGRQLAADRNLGYKMFGPTPLTNNGGMAISMLKGMGIAYGISGAGSFISSIIKESAEYDNLMATVRNILQANTNVAGFGGEFANMEQVVREVGLKTKFKTTDVAGAAKFLAMAGIDATGIKESISPIANLALIGDTDLAETADLITNVMTGYNIASTRMENIADVMTRTFTRTNVTLPEIAESFKYSASLLSAGGIDFEESTAAIGILGDAGIKGSQAGTTLRTIMSNFVNPRGKKRQAKWDEVGVKRFNDDGSVRSMAEIFTDLSKKGLTVADFYQLFDKTAASGAVALAMHVNKWNDVIKANFLSDGLSEQLADKKKATIQGLWAQFTSAISEVGLRSFGGIEDKIKRLLVSATEFVLSPKGQEAMNNLFEKFWELVDALKSVVKFFGDFFSMFGGGMVTLMKIQLLIWPLTKIASLLRQGGLALQSIPAGINAIQQKSANIKNFFAQAKESGSRGKFIGRAAVSYFTGRPDPYLERQYNQTYGDPNKGGSFKGAPTPSATPSTTSSGNGGTTVVPTPANNSGSSRGWWKRNFGKQKFSAANIRRNFGSVAGGVGNAAAMGAGMALGGIAGNYIGDTLGGENGGMIGSLVGSMAGGALFSAAGSWVAGLAPVILSPIGIAALGIAGAAAMGIGYLVKMKKEADKTREATEKWNASLRSGGLNTLDWKRDNALQIANFSIMNNKLMDQNQKLKAAIDSWHNYYEARKDPDNENQFVVTNPAVKDRQEQMLKDFGGNWETWEGRFNHPDLGISWKWNKQGLHVFSVPGMDYMVDPDKSTEDNQAMVAAMLIGAESSNNPDDPLYNPEYAKQVEAISNIYLSSKSRGNVDQQIDDWVKTSVKEIPKYENLTAEQYESLIGKAEFFKIPAAQRTSTKKARENTARMYRPLHQSLWAMEQGKNVSAKQFQKALQNTSNEAFILLDERFGVFGTPQWMQNVTDWMYDDKGYAIDSNVQMFLSLFNELNKLYGKVSLEDKKYLIPYADRDLFYAMTPANYRDSFPEIGIPGLRAPSKNGGALYGENQNGQKLIRITKPNLWGVGAPAWYVVDDKGKVSDAPYVGTDVISTISTDPYTQFKFSGKHFDPEKVGKGVLASSRANNNLNGAYSYVPNASSEAFRQTTNINTDKPVAMGNQVVYSGDITFHTEIKMPDGTTVDQGEKLANTLVQSWQNYSFQQS